jgi:hypothetical protein
LDCTDRLISGMIDLMLLFQRGKTERKIAIRVLLRLTRMDVCCGPPAL